MEIHSTTPTSVHPKFTTYSPQTLQSKDSKHNPDHSIKDSTDRLEIKQNHQDFKASLKKQLLDSLFNQAKSTDQVSNEWIDPILYAVDKETEAAEVPEYWNAENTSQRIVDFAVSFLSLYEGDNESYRNEMREAIQQGFKEAKEMLGELPGESAKLFNDTYELSMKKFDQYFEDLKNGTVSPTDELTAVSPLTQEYPALDLVA